MDPHASWKYALCVYTSNTNSKYGRVCGLFNFIKIVAAVATRIRKRVDKSTSLATHSFLLLSNYLLMQYFAFSSWSVCTNTPLGALNAHLLQTLKMALEALLKSSRTALLFPIVLCDEISRKLYYLLRNHLY